MHRYHSQRSVGLILITLLVVGCATVIKHEFDQRWGEPEVQYRFTTNNLGHVPDYNTDIQPILDKRCVVCHACYDAPCQLNLTSYQGLDRGASKALIYDGARLTAAAPSRLFIDENSTQGWRDRGYFPVLNERLQTPAANLQGSVLYRMLEMKRLHSLPNEGPLEDFEFGLDRDTQCASVEEMDDYQEDYEQWGMPYGMQGIDDEDYQAITTWIANGSPVKRQAALEKKYLAEIAKWEALLNGRSLKEQLFSRYVYEHLYLGNLYFEALGHEQYFKLVRSRTSSGNAIDEIASRRPFDSPGDQAFYYRLRPVKSTIVDKTHMPYALNQEKFEKWTAWFIDADYAVNALPGYGARVASNPFKVFKQIPAKARFKFMLEEAAFTIMGYIKGPVCRGQVALNVIEDHFWVYFVNPEVETMLYDPNVGDTQIDHMNLPAQNDSTASPLEIWTTYADLQKQHLNDKLAFINKKTRDTPFQLDETVIWDGDGSNDNAALTIYRHFDNATVIKGLHGKKPKTAWVISYSLLERIHYLLVAGFDVYGNLGHQLNTRLYMDFLRMEGESQFLMLLPNDEAAQEFKAWYNEAEEQVDDYLALLQNAAVKDPSIKFSKGANKLELYDILSSHIDKNTLPHYSLLPEQKPRASLSNALAQLAMLEGEAVSQLPELSVMRLTLENGAQQVLTLALNRHHKNVSTLFLEEDNLDPQRDYMSLFPGILGSYPNMFFDVKETEIEAFIQDLNKLADELSYAEFVEQWGIRRNSDNFWPFIDWLHDWYRKEQPLQAGIMDLNRYQNP